jgi:hypothetical protein
MFSMPSRPVDMRPVRSERKRVATVRVSSRRAISCLGGRTLFQFRNLGGVPRRHGVDVGRLEAVRGLRHEGRERTPSTLHLGGEKRELGPEMPDVLALKRRERTCSGSLVATGAGGHVPFGYTARGDGLSAGERVGIERGLSAKDRRRGN